MSLIIDGYNLMHAAGIIPLGAGPGGLERSRLALLDFIAESVDDAERSTTTVVFDAAAAPPGLPRTLAHRGVTVRFSSGYNDADELIEELIQQSAAPRRLTVVSSDHRLHRAARRRKAQAIDSDLWHAEIIKRRRQSQAVRPAAAQKPATPVATSEVEFWLKTFSESAEPAARPARKPRAAPQQSLPTTTPVPAKRKPPRGKSTRAKPGRSRKPPVKEQTAGDVFPQEYLDSINEE